jgi:hypothetical protein
MQQDARKPERPKHQRPTRHHRRDGPTEPGDEQDGAWPKADSERMDEAFRFALARVAKQGQ